MAPTLRARFTRSELPLRWSGKKRCSDDVTKDVRKRKRQTSRAMTSKTSVSTDQYTYTALSSPRSLKNPQAKLQGLPAELRLHIYDHLCESTILHVHQHEDREFARQDPRFTWTPCKLANPSCHLLCANPKWSGLCAEEDRCTYKIYAPPKPRGFAALAATCKSIRSEAWAFFIRKSVISIHPKDLRLFLDYLEKHAPKQCQAIRRITLTGPAVWGISMQYDLLGLRDRVPGLEAVGFQGQVPWYQFSETWSSASAVVAESKWRDWQVAQWMRIFPPTVTVAMEGLMWFKSYQCPPNDEEQVIVQIFREGKSTGSEQLEGSGWEDKDIELEVYRPGGIAEKSVRAKWRQWWRTKDTMGFA